MPTRARPAGSEVVRAPCRRQKLQSQARSAQIDGEIAVLLPDGRTSFQALQKSLAGERQGELVYFVFDLFELDGVDVSREPLEARKEALRRIVPDAGPIRFSRHWAGGGD